MARLSLPGHRPCPAHGMAYLWLLFFIAFMGANLAVAGVVWELRVRREKEADLLAIGNEMRVAIRNYFELSPGGAKQLPARLEDLVEDKRFPVPRRHLRRIYPDPLTTTADWGLILLGGRITGVYSEAPGTPIKQGDFAPADTRFAGAQRYAEWRFVPAEIASPVVPVKPAAPAAATPATTPAAKPEAGGLSGR